MTDTLIVIGFGCSLVLVLVTAAATLRFLERRFPAFSRWLDRVVGEEPKWLQPW